jgi:ATP synthase I chain
MAGLTVAGMVVALLLGEIRTAAGFGLGAGVALFGYSWLHNAVVKLMDAGSERPSKLMLGKFAVRYPLAIVAIFIVYRENWLPYEAVLAGLFVPVAGAVAESLYQVSSLFLRSKAL